MPYPGLLHPEPLSLQQATADPDLLRRHLNTVLSQSLWDLWVLVCTRYFWALWASLVGMGFDSKCNFTPPPILLGLLLCPRTWGISSKSLQRHTATAPAPTILLGLHFSALGHGVSPHSRSSVTLYRRQWSKPTPRKRNAKRQNGYLRRPYKQLWKEEKWKAKEKRKDIPIWVQSFKE